MRSFKLQYFVNKLVDGEKFSLARYGDGELYCMWGKQGQNSNGCRYSPELRQALIESLRHKNDLNFIYGIQRILPKDMKIVQSQYWDVNWCDSELFGEAVANGKLYPLIKQLRKMSVTVIGNKTIKDFVQDELDADFIEVSSSNAYDAGLKLEPLDGRVYLFSCGMAANAFIAELHGRADCWLIDLGHIWDPFVGNMSRCDLEGKTMEDINKNLKK